MNSSPETSRHTILIISPWKSRWSLGAGAGVSDDHHFVETLSRNGFDLHFLIPKSDEPAAPDNVTTHTYPNFFDATARWPTPVRRLLWPICFNIVVTLRALRVTQRIRPDFILGHSHYSSLPCYMVRELLRVPTGVKLFGVMDLVQTGWSKSKYYFKNIEQIAALKIPQDVWIILDDGTKGADAARRHGVPEEKIHFLPNGINVEWMNESYDGDGLRDELGFGKTDIVVLFLARLVASKRPGDVIRAVPEVVGRTQHPVRFLVVGDGDMRGECEALVRSLGVGDHVTFAGAVPHERVPEVMAASDMFVSTSRLTNAAIPTCEALVCGLPVIAYDTGNTSEVVRDGEMGRVVADGDTSALAEAIVGLANDEETRERMARRAQSFAAETFTPWDVRTQMEVDILRRIIDSRTGVAATIG